MNKDKSEQQRVQEILERILCDRLPALLHQQAQKTRKETLEEVVNTLTLAPIWRINTGLIDHIRAGESYASWRDVLDKLQSLINNQ